MNNKIALVVSLVAVVIAIGAYNYPIAPIVEKALGGESNFDTVAATGFAIGSGCNLENASCLATTFTGFVGGTCTAQQVAAGSHTATTSKEFFCTASNVLASDKVFVMLPAGAGAFAGGGGSGGASSGGFIAQSAFATTSGVIGFSIYNGTGAATTSYAQATTSVQYWVFR